MSERERKKNEKTVNLKMTKKISHLQKYSLKTCKNF